MNSDYCTSSGHSQQLKWSDLYLEIYDFYSELVIYSQNLPVFIGSLWHLIRIWWHLVRIYQAGLKWLVSGQYYFINTDRSPFSYKSDTVNQT